MGDLTAPPIGWEVHGNELRGSFEQAHVGWLWWMIRLLSLPVTAVLMVLLFLLAMVADGIHDPAPLGDALAWVWSTSPWRREVVLTAHQLRIGRSRFPLHAVKRVEVAETALIVQLRYHRRRFPLYGNPDLDALQWFADRVAERRSEGTSADVPEPLKALRPKAPETRG